MATNKKAAPASTETGKVGNPHGIEATSDGDGHGEVTATPPDESTAKNDRKDLQAKGQRAAGGEDEGQGDTSVPGSGVLVADAPIPEPAPQPAVEYDIAPLDPLDSSEAWKEQERVPTGKADSGSDTKSGHRAGEDSKADSHAPETDSDRKQSFDKDQKGLAQKSASQTISSRPDGTLSAGLAPNSVVQVPEGVPAPINPLSNSESVQDRVLYENWVNSEAEVFATEARTRFINAAIAGKSLTISGDEDLGEPIDANDDDLGETYDDGKLPTDGSEDRGIVPKGPDADRDYS